MYQSRRRFRKPDLMTSLTVSVVVAVAVTVLLPYM
jgi:hypothetical protein